MPERFMLVNINFEIKKFEAIKIADLQSWYNKKIQKKSNDTERFFAEKVVSNCEESELSMLAIEMSIRCFQKFQICLKFFCSLQLKNIEFKWETLYFKIQKF